MKVYVKFVGGKVGRGENLLFFLPILLLPLATTHWILSRATKHWNLSRATKHWNLPLATKLGSSFTSFFFFLFKRANSNNLGLYFWRIIFNSNLENTCSHNLLE
jgi:hypothetical protein